jgi:hypothetical protein
MRFRIGTAALSFFLLVASASSARADVVLTPYVGTLFGGDVSGAKFQWGGSATFMGGGIFGAEIDFHHVPEFVEETASDPAVAQMSLSGNLIVGIPIRGTQGGSVRPYVTGGVGLLRSMSDESDFLDSISTNDFAVNFGGGIMGFFTDRFGIRTDIRYYRALRDEDPDDDLDFDFGDFEFWKWSVGAAFRF